MVLLISTLLGVALPPITPIQGALVSILVLGAIMCAYLAIFSWKQRPGMNAWLFSALAGAIIIYTLSYCGELLSPNHDSMLIFVRLEYIGAANLPALWLSLVLFYTNHIQWLKCRRLLLIWIIPLITLFAVFTNSNHHLYYVTTYVSVDGPFPTLSFTRGPLYWLQVFYTYSTFLGSTILLARQLRHSHLLFRKQIALMLISSMVTIAITILHLIFISPIPGLDIVPFALMISCLIIGWGILGYQLAGISPIARDELFESQIAGALVLDDQNQLVDFNLAARAILQFPSDSIGRSLSGLLPIEIRPVFENLMQQHTSLEIKLPSARFFDVSFTPLSSKKHHFIGTLIVLNESTERKAAQRALEQKNHELIETIRQLKITEQALQSSESHYRLLAQNTNDVIWEMDLSGHFSYVSPSVERLRGFTPAEVIQQSLNEIVCPASLSLIADHIQQAIQMALQGQSTPLKFLEIEQPCKDGSTVWTEATAQLILNERGDPVGFVGVSRNIMERKKADLQLKHDATHDGLTGLPNRVYFLDRLGSAIQSGRNKSGTFSSVLFLDIDEFKIINDSLGHAYGDQLLKTIGNRLKNCISSEDTVARLGGDEFVFLIENLQGIDEVKSVAARILGEIQQPFQLYEHRVFISASIGVIPSLSGYTQPENILRDADITMYRAKSLGKARFEIFEPLLLNKAISRLEIESDLRRAIESAKFKLLYQPIFSLPTQEIVGFEALLRLDDPAICMISPSEFIPIAEETGLIGPIGRWVLHEACSKAKKWLAHYPQVEFFRISVNISAKQFLRPDFIDQIKNVLQETGLKANCLTLEITESVFIGNASKAKSIFSSLCDLGVQLQIDDFGTGYSSLRYIKHFPIDTIKIDQSFIKEIHLSNKDADLVHAIVLMAHSLGMETIAEGIENQNQLVELLKYGCHYGQGFFLSRPLDDSLVEALLEKTQSKIDRAYRAVTTPG